VTSELLTQKIPSHRTGGAHSLFEIVTRPGAGPPPQIQHCEDEYFYVLEEDYEFLLEGRTLRADAGCLLYVPNSTFHSNWACGR
jgi:mannose-6-phosphate isomerase-like protein (cupin superfamily)